MKPVAIADRRDGTTDSCGEIGECAHRSYARVIRHSPLVIAHMDLVFIKGLKCQTILGVYAWERVSLRPVLIDLEIGADQEAAFVHDNAVGLMNYDSISKRLSELLPTLTYKTVERLAAHMAEVVLKEFHAPYVKVTIGKPGAVANAAMVGVTIVRRAG
jgi:7,8-dihydroneopterin aldolase/epimerase/oxygenase